MLRSLVVAALLGASSVAAVKCTRSSHCPEDSPCCSTYGECGVGAYCLGGCDPTMSFSLDSCVPAPVCEDRKMKMNSLDSIVDIGKYLGDSSKADWVAQGEPVVFQNNVLLTMPKDSVGTLLSSTVYMWYGNVKARFKTSRGAGVITAFILFSDVKDEIDYEFVGTELGDAQTNYYFQGITNYENSENITLSDTFANFHDYEIRWTPDKIEWWVDGKLGRTLQKSDTWNATSKNFDFPQTPSRVQLSLWPGGKEGNAEGTVAWAGGPIDWDAPDIQKSGYYFATFSDVEIQCFNAKSGPGSNSGTSYWYKDAAGTNDTIVDGDKRHTIASLMATGEDMDKGKKEDKKKDSKDDDKDDKDSKDSKDSKDKDDDDEPATIPGGSSGAPSNDHGDDSSDDSSSGSGSGSSSAPKGNPDGSTDDTEPADTTNCETNSFNQDCASSSSSSSSSKSSSSSDDGKGSNAGTRNGASALAIIIAGGALFWL